MRAVPTADNLWDGIGSGRDDWNLKPGRLVGYEPTGQSMVSIEKSEPGPLMRRAMLESEGN